MRGKSSSASLFACSASPATSGLAATREQPRLVVPLLPLTGGGRTAEGDVRASAANSLQRLRFPVADACHAETQSSGILE